MDNGTIHDAQAGFERDPGTCADGHHRYGTSTVEKCLQSVASGTVRREMTLGHCALTEPKQGTITQILFGVGHIRYFSLKFETKNRQHAAGKNVEDDRTMLFLIPDFILSREEDHGGCGSWIASALG